MKPPSSVAPQRGKGRAAKDSTVLIGIVFAFLMLLFGIASIKVVEARLDPVDYAEAHDLFSEQQRPTPRRLQAPHAVLVLDVSASMMDGDKAHLQTAAALRFFEVYSGLAKETLIKDEKARLAVVFFSTLAQTVTWGEAQETWLDATPANRPVFEAAMARYLGMPELDKIPDPRQGRDTDYLEALKAVESLVQDPNIISPPVVIFMTDGKNEPCISILKRDKDPIRQRALETRVGAFQRVHADRGEIYKAHKAELPQFPSGDKENENEIHALVSHLAGDSRYHMQGVEEALPLHWAPILLSQKATVTAEGKRLLGYDPMRPPKICTESDQLAEKFLDILSDWFRLLPNRASGSPLRVSIPEGTQVFAALVSCDPSTPPLSLRGPGGQVVEPRGGAQRVCLARGDGEWTLDGVARSMVIYARPRHAWVFNVPILHVVEGAISELPLELHLVNLETNKSVPARELPGALPPTLVCTVAGTGGAPLHVQLSKCRGSGDAAFQGRLIHGTEASRCTLRVTLELPAELRELVGPSETRLEQSIRMAPTVILVAQTSKGRPTGVHLRIPSSLGWLHRLMPWSGNDR